MAVKGVLYECGGTDSCTCNVCPNRKTCVFWQVDPAYIDNGLSIRITTIENRKGQKLTLIEKK